MLWLLTLLTLILDSTFAIGGLIFGRINVEYGLCRHFARGWRWIMPWCITRKRWRTRTFRFLKSAAASHNIFWAAVTVYHSFSGVELRGIPGLAQLGSLVGLGVALSACVMIFAFLPPLFPDRWEPKSTTSAKVPTSRSKSEDLAEEARSKDKRHLVFAVTAVFIRIRVAILAFGLPPMDPPANALRPETARVYEALDQIKNALNQNREPLWLLVLRQNRNRSRRAVGSTGANLRKGHERSAHRHSHFARSFPLQNINAKIEMPWKSLIAERPVFHEAAKTNGFAESSMALMDWILDTWEGPLEFRRLLGRPTR